MRYRTQPRQTNIFERYGFLSSARKFDDKYGKILTDTAIKSGKDAVKTASQKVGQKQHKQEDI